MKKLLNLKNMKETLVNYSGDNEELNKIWDALHTMACYGKSFLINAAAGTWTKKTLVCAMN